jgi:hypothetical protein
MSIFITYLLLQLLGIVLVILASISEAIMDTLMFHYDRSIFIEKQNQQFWNPKESWKNKYKEDLVTPKFLGSTTLFVFLTDAWHKYKFNRNTLLFISLPLIGYLSISILHLILSVIIARVAFGIFFTYYHYKYSNKELKILSKIKSVFNKLNIFKKSL